MIVTGWALAASDADAHRTPPTASALSWQQIDAARPVAAVRPKLSNRELDDQDWWYRTIVEPGAGERLVFESIATVADIYLDGTLVAHSESMFRPVAVPIPAASRPLEVAVCCRALGPLLARRRTPRARWRTQLVADGNLRFHRTMLLGRAPGFAAGPAAVGLCGPVRAERVTVTDGISLRSRLDGADGILTVSGTTSLAGAEIVLDGPTGRHTGAVGTDLRIAEVARWWPHTHGEPSLYAVSVAGVPVGRVGFRTLSWPEDWEERGFGLAVNGVDLFCRGAVWTPPKLADVHSDPDVLAARLGLVVDAGMNMLRIPGTATYESDAFHDLCDELGILVWQDMMFANLDYPDGEPEFVAEVEAEAAHQLGRVAGRPSLAVICGGSECAQQVTMLGLDPELAAGPLYRTILPAAVAASGADAAYVPNTPWGGRFPFRPDTGVANYYGVGAYRRDISDAALSQVGFSAECLAFSNVGEHDDDLAPGGTPRDTGAGWDFADVRDHYLALLYGVDPTGTRWTDVERYLELSRGVTGEVMAEALGIWRAVDSPTRGALLLWLADLEPGSGWGLIDDRGVPKAAYHRLAQALAPQALWLTDEGLGGIDVHVANDRPDPLAATLRVALYRDGQLQVASAQEHVSVPGHGALRLGVEDLLGRFADVNWVYRFGPPQHDLVVAALETADGPISQACAFPVGRPLDPRSVEDVALTAQLERTAAGAATLSLSAGRVVHGLRIRAAGWRPSVDFLTLEPGRPRTVALASVAGADHEPVVRLTALNVRGSVRVRENPTAQRP